jgi:MFS family permease
VSSVSAGSPAPPVTRNTILLAASLATFSGMLQLAAAIATITFVLITGIDALLGLGPAILLSSGAVAALFAGRAMDRFGRIPVLAVGYVAGMAGSGLIALAAHAESSFALIPGLALVGAFAGVANLTRTAAGDMYPPERRARGISFVLFGSVFGAILGPAVFAPLFAGRDLEAESLVVPWLAGGGFLIVGLALVLAVRPDPKRIAELLGTSPGAPTPAAAAPLSEILRRPGALPALLAALASFGVMVSVMNLTGYVVVTEHGHEQNDVFPIIGAHVLGMYALVLFVGPVIDRIGRTQALVGGLTIMALACVPLAWVGSVGVTGVLLFGLGLGWNLSFVAATAQLADLTSPAERGKVLGFSDLLSGILGASLALLGGFALEALGVIALAAGATVIALAPVTLIVRGRKRPDPALATISDR